MDPKKQDSEQLWWFVTESAEDSKYDQRSKLLSEVRRKNPNFSDILSLLRLEGKPEDYNFWIHSPSMNAAVQLLKDTAIDVIWTLYCRDDPTVTIIVRPSIRPFPKHLNSAECQIVLSGAAESIRET